MRIRKWSWTVPSEIRNLMTSQRSAGPGVDLPIEGDEETQSSPISVGLKAGRDSATEQVLSDAEEPGDETPVPTEGGPDHNGGNGDLPTDGKTHTQEPAPIVEVTSLPVHYSDALVEQFNKPSRHVHEDESFESDGKVANPDRRRDRTRVEIEKARDDEPPAKERFDFVRVKQWEPKNSDTRIKLQNWYDGKCQICGTTFTKRYGGRYFEGLYLVSRAHARWIDRPGNVLCLWRYLLREIPTWHRPCRARHSPANQVFEVRGGGRL